MENQETPEWLTENADGSVDIKLSKPVDIDGVEVGTLRMREPTVQDQLTIQRMKGDDAAKDVAMMSNLCEVAPAVIQQLTLRSYKRVQEAYMGFTE